MPNYIFSPHEYNQDGDGSKFAIFGNSQGSCQYLSVERGHYSQHEPNSLEDTPSLTTGSTRSSSTSIQGCRCSSHDEAGNGQCRERRRDGEILGESLHERTLGDVHQSIPKIFLTEDIRPFPRVHRAPTPNSPLAKPTYFCSLPLTPSATVYTENHLETPKDTTAQNSDIEISDDGESEFENEDDESDWSGPSDHIESLVLDVLANNLPLASHLIPTLHKFLHTQISANIKQKVGPWCEQVTTYVSAVGTSGKQNSSSASTSNTSSRSISSSRIPRKRARLTDNESSQGGEEEEDGDGDRGHSNDAKRMSHSDGSEVRFACPFNKRSAAQYSTGKFRICAGPGWRSLKDVKEHLKRKHYPVQCERCFHIFPCKERAAGLLELEKHNQQVGGCQPRQDNVREGISNLQWALLEKKNGPKKEQDVTAVEKWFELWKILFPEAKLPKTPWYEIAARDTASRTLSEEENRFCRVFKEILDHQVQDGDIRFADGTEDEMKQRVELSAQQAFLIITGMFERGSSSGQSGGSSRTITQKSSLGESYEKLHISNPTVTGNQQPMASLLARSTSVQTQPQNYRMDISASPRSGSFTANAETEQAPAQHPSTIYSPYMRDSMSPSNMIPQNFTHFRQTSMTNQRGDFGARVHPNTNIDPFADTRFNSQGPNEWRYPFPTSFNHPNAMSGIEESGTIDPSRTLLEFDPLTGIWRPAFSREQQRGGHADS